MRVPYGGVTNTDEFMLRLTELGAVSIVLAWRLGFAFVHVRLPWDRVPLGRQLMNHLGRPLTPLLFAEAG